MKYLSLGAGQSCQRPLLASFQVGGHVPLAGPPGSAGPPHSSPFPSARVGDGWGPRGGGRPRRSLLTSRGPGCQRHVMFGGGGLSTFTFGGGEHPDSQKRKTNRRGKLKHARGYLPPELRLGGGRNTRIRFSSWKTSKTI